MSNQLNPEQKRAVQLCSSPLLVLAGAGSERIVEIENTGHHHLLIDVKEMPDFNQPLPATQNIRHFGKGQSESELRLAEGPHTLQLLLADHLHIPHKPPVMSKVTNIVVSADAPPQTEESKE